MAAGSLCLMRYVPGIEEFFTHGIDCFLYDSVKSALEQIPRIIEYAGRNTIATRGQRNVRANFMYDNIVQMFEKAIG